MLAVVGVVAVAGIVWAIGTTLMDRHPGADGGAKPVDSKATQAEPSPDTSQRPSAEARSEVVTISQEGNGSIQFPASVAAIHGANPMKTFQQGEAVIENWTSSDDWLEWSFNVVKPGAFRVEVSYKLIRVATAERTS